MPLIVECRGCVGQELAGSFRDRFADILTDMDHEGNFHIFHSGMDPCDFDDVIRRLALFLREQGQDEARFPVVMADTDEQEISCGLVWTGGIQKIDLSVFAVKCKDMEGPICKNGCF